MTDTLTALTEPVTQCGACGQSDDHPKHQVIFVGIAGATRMYHEHDFAREGCIYYHFDCPTEWNDLHSKLAVDPRPAVIDPSTGEIDPATEWTEENAAKHRAQADIHAAKCAKALSGVHGAELRQWIQNLNPRGGAGGMDQAMGTALLTAMTPNSSTKTVGSKTITGPINARFMTANGSDSANGTELGSGGSYVAGTGIVLAFGTAASDSVSTNAAASQTNMPSCVLTGPEFWDSSGSPQRTYWGPWAGGNITVGSANTLTIASGNATITQS